MLGDIRKRLVREIWHSDLHSEPLPRRFVIFFLRLLYVLGRELAGGELTLRAMGLVYTALLALVPLLAFLFAILKALGVQNRLEPMLFDFLAPLGEKGEEISARIINFVDNVRAGVLGTLGLLLLLWTVISLVQKVESAFNYIWRVREARSLSERFSHYLSVIIIGPALVIAALVITATLSSPTVVREIETFLPLGRLIVVSAKILPYVLVIAAFTFLYILMPHTHVKFRAALAGGVFAGVLWEFAGWAFAVLAVNSTRLTAVYSGFAILIMFMMWIYLCWLILFLGAQLSFYVQNPELVRHGRGYGEVGGHTLERVALHVMYLIGRSFHESKPPWSREDLARRLRVPTETILDVLGRLHDNGLVMLISGRIRRYVPGRDLSSIRLRDIVTAMRHNRAGREDVDQHLRSVDSVDKVMKQMEHAIEATLGDVTLKELVEQETALPIASIRRA